jgi:hypothetical protein
MDAFISHSSKDMKLAIRIEKVLEQDGLKIWLDRSEIRLGVLLRKELQNAIKDSRLTILLWSKAAAKSLWVAAEVLTTFHLNRFIVSCVRDGTQLPYFLQNTIHLEIGSRKTQWIARLRRAVRESPDSANELPTFMSSQSRELQQVIRRITLGQQEVTNSLEQHDLKAALKSQQAVHRITLQVEKVWRLEPMVLNLAGYHRKNAYLVKHWSAIQAGRPPKDRLLERAERFFFETLFVNPIDYSALNGLGSVLILDRDLEAAEFFIRRAITLAEQDGIDYPAARHDLAMIEAFTGRRTVVEKRSKPNA